MSAVAAGDLDRIGVILGSIPTGERPAARAVTPRPRLRPQEGHHRATTPGTKLLGALCTTRASAGAWAQAWSGPVGVPPAKTGQHQNRRSGLCGGPRRFDGLSSSPPSSIHSTSGVTKNAIGLTVSRRRPDAAGLEALGTCWPLLPAADGQFLLSERRCAPSVDAINAMVSS
jgi:hypothetical protein